MIMIYIEGGYGELIATHAKSTLTSQESFKMDS